MMSPSETLPVNRFSYPVEDRRKALAHDEEIKRLHDEIAMRDRDLEFYRNAPKGTADGSLFDSAKTPPKEIARILRENHGLATRDS
jgi:hypothetical protein